MNNFAYLDILKLAFEIARKRYWLWIFGLFIGGTSGLNMGATNYFLASRPDTEDQLGQAGRQLLDWINNNAEVFWIIVAAALFVFLVLVVLQGWAKAAIIWSAAKLSEDKRGMVAEENVNFRASLAAGRQHLWRIILLQIFITLAFSLLLFIFITPVLYLLSHQAIGRAVLLLLLGLTVLIPASLIFGFLHLYGPIIVVLYHRGINGALRISFDLITHKLRESVVLAAFLIGLNLLFILALGFGIILFSVPVALLALLLLKLGFSAATYALVVAALTAAATYTVTLTAGFSAFQNIAWVLAVREMMRPKKLEDEAKVLAVEPVAE